MPAQARQSQSPTAEDGDQFEELQSPCFVLVLLRRRPPVRNAGKEKKSRQNDDEGYHYGSGVALHLRDEAGTGSTSRLFKLIILRVAHRIAEVDEKLGQTSLGGRIISEDIGESCISKWFWQALA